MSSYSLVVDVDGKVPLVNVPRPKAGETFGQWKARVFGNADAKVRVFLPTVPGARKKMDTLTNAGSVAHLNRGHRALRKQATEKAAAAHAAAVTDAQQRCLTIPQDILTDMLLQPGFELEPAVKDFLGRFAKQPDGSAKLEVFLRSIIKKCNAAARVLRENSKK